MAAMPAPKFELNQEVRCIKPYYMPTMTYPGAGWELGKMFKVHARVQGNGTWAYFGANGSPGVYEEHLAPYSEKQEVEKKENVMSLNPSIVKLYPKTSEAVLVEKWFGSAFAQNSLNEIFAVGKEAEILAAAQVKEDIQNPKK